MGASGPLRLTSSQEELLPYRHTIRPSRGSNARGAPRPHEELLVQILHEELLICTTSSSLGKSGRGALRMREELL
eukprot:3145262-Pleurochrysis_carterae.AAC.1